MQKQRVTSRTLENYVDSLNAVYTNSGTHEFKLDIAYGGYQITWRNKETTAESNLNSRGTAKETYNYLQGLMHGLRMEVVRKEKTL
jgi:hypothetical protein